MRYRPLGRGGLLVSELALGTMIFGERNQRSATPAEAERMIFRFLEAGGNHIDTANVYAGGRSEEIIGKALKGKRQGVVLATKVRFRTGDGPNDLGLSRYHIMDSVEASLKRLQVETIDLLYMHSWDPLAPLEETLRAFNDLATSDKVRYFGVSNFKAWQVMKALGVSDAHGWARIVAAQYQYSLVARDIDLEFTDLFLSEGVGLVPWGPLGGGFLSGKYKPGDHPSDPSQGRLAVTPDDYEEAWTRRATSKNWRTLDMMGEILADHPGATFSQVALAWLLNRPAVSSVIIGVRTMEQLEDNLKAEDLHLSAEEISRLDEVSALPEGYPYRLINTEER